MKKHIPILLIYTRLLIGFLVIGLQQASLADYKFFAISLVCIGLITDIVDGIVARKLGVSTQKVRRLDSSVDGIFYVCIAIATYLQRPSFFREHSLQLGILIAFEACTYLVSFIKFRKEVATHSIGAKLWSLFLFSLLIQLIAQGESGFLFTCFFWLGILTRIEIVAILLILKKWTNDIPTFYHALRLRQGKEIKRHTMLNG